MQAEISIHSGPCPKSGPLRDSWPQVSRLWYSAGETPTPRKAAFFNGLPELCALSWMKFNGYAGLVGRFGGNGGKHRMIDRIGRTGTSDITRIIGTASDTDLGDLPRCEPG